MSALAAAPHLPNIILGDDPNLLQQMNLVEHGAQDYLLKRRLDADTLIGMVHSAIARKSREGILCFQVIDATTMRDPIRLIGVIKRRRYVSWHTDGTEKKVAGATESMSISRFKCRRMPWQVLTAA
jgi:hypothetical protein